MIQYLMANSNSVALSLRKSLSKMVYIILVKQNITFKLNNLQ